jgi:methionine sulfoxide reductase heme-binding subunit
MTTLASTATFSSSPLWFLTRSTGIIAFLLLTVTTMLGIATTQRALASKAWPRFATQQLHRNISLVSMVFLVVHIVTSILDSYVNIGWTTFVIPGTSGYENLWVSVGTISFDLILVVIVSSLLRTRIPARLWRTLHWSAYIAWPFALLHFLNTGTDAAHQRWGLWLGLATIVFVLAAGAVRVATTNLPRPLTSIRSAR